MSEPETVVTSCTGSVEHTRIRKRTTEEVEGFDAEVEKLSLFAHS